MRSLKYKQWLLLAISVLCCVGMFFLQFKPKISKKKLATHSKLEEAIRFVKDGTNPMQGIGLLKEVLNEDSMNVDALYYLGVFSVQSGQLDKALGRFLNIIRIDSTHFEANYYLANLYLEIGDSSKAVFYNAKVKKQIDSNNK